jgi:uncharacterized protein (DUF4213/DUF364 family)
MGIIEDVLQEINDKPADEITIGEAFVGVKIGTRIGVSHRVDEIGKLNNIYENLKGRELTNLIYSQDFVKKAIATAAINAQLEPRNFQTGNVFKKILKVANNYDKIAIIGKFPIINQLKELGCKIYAFEKKTIPGFLPVEKEKELIPTCDLVIITGTAFVNGTLRYLLELSNGYTMIVGPTSPVTEVLFHYNVKVVAGIFCTNTKVLDIIRMGGGTKEFKKYVETIYIEKR